MGKKAGVALDDVLDAAEAVANRAGLANLTLADVAARLGIRSPSLYNHVAGLAGLRRSLAIRSAGRLADDLVSASEDRSGVDALRAFAAAYREFASAHPGSYEAIQAGADPAEDPDLAAALGAPVAIVAATLIDLGHRPGDVIPLIRAFRSALHGFVDLERVGGFGLPEDIDASFDITVDTLIAGIVSRAGALN